MKEEGQKMALYKIKVTPQAEEELRQAASFLGLKSGEDVILKALSLINFVAKEMHEGGKLVIENEKLNVRKEIAEL